MSTTPTPGAATEPHPTPVPDVDHGRRSPPGTDRSWVALCERAFDPRDTHLRNLVDEDNDVVVRLRD
jgi:hypothetical protein